MSKRKAESSRIPSVRDVPVFQPRVLLYALLAAWILVDILMAVRAEKEYLFGLYGAQHFEPFYLLWFVVFAAILYAALMLLYAFWLRRLDNEWKTWLRSPLPALLLVCLCFRNFYFGNFNRYVLYYDTTSYVEYPHNILLGQVDEFRTPVYPYFLKLTKLLFGESGFYRGTVIVQMALSLVSVVFLYCALKLIVKNRYVVCITTLLYGCSPMVLQWDLCILTESLTLTSFTVMLYLMLRYLKHPTTPLAIGIGLYTFYLLMLRPTFLYFFAILGAFWVARFLFSKFDRRQTVAGFLSLIVALGLTGGYCLLNQRSNGFFGISSVGTNINQLYIVIDNGYYDNPEFPELSEFIHHEKYMDPEVDGSIPQIIIDVGNNYDLTTVNRYVKSCLSLYRDEYRAYTKEKFLSLLEHSMHTQYSSYDERAAVSFTRVDTNLCNVMYPFTFLGFWLIVGAGLVWVAAVMIRKRRIAWQLLGLCAIAFTHVFVSIYASMAEYQRLSIIAIGPLFLILAYFAGLFVGDRRSLSRGIEETSAPFFDRGSRKGCPAQEDAALVATETAFSSAGETSVPAEAMPLEGVPDAGSDEEAGEQVV